MLLIMAGWFFIKDFNVISWILNNLNPVIHLIVLLTSAEVKVTPGKGEQFQFDDRISCLFYAWMMDVFVPGSFLA